jgi:hypothetical protein
MVRALEKVGDEIVGNLSTCFLLLSQIFIVFSIISMIIFACVDGTNGEQDAAKKDDNKKNLVVRSQLIVVGLVVMVVAVGTIETSAASTLVYLIFNALLFYKPVIF